MNVFRINCDGGKIYPINYRQAAMHSFMHNVVVSLDGDDQPCFSCIYIPLFSLSVSVFQSEEFSSSIF